MATTHEVKAARGGQANAATEKPETATLSFRGKSYELPVVVGSEGEIGVDISNLRDRSGLITLDDGYANTGSCSSAVAFIDGEKGILRYRGYPIEELAEKSNFSEVAYLLIFGELPTASQLAEFRAAMTDHMFIHEDLRNHFEGFPPNAHPMAILSAMLNATSCYQAVFMKPAAMDDFMEMSARIISKVRTIAAAAYKKSIGQPMIYPRPDLRYAGNFLHMMFSKPNAPYEPDPDVTAALDQILILHADHEQNCSTSTVRMVGSSQANLWASVSAGVNALWGPLHGGANQAVIEMLTQIHESGESPDAFVTRLKNKDSTARLMGFGHRVYKNYDPRAAIIKRACHKVLSKMGRRDPLLDIAMRLEEVALKDPYFVERKLYPNVDFYSGIIMRAIGVPLNMFTVMFAIGRMPGWISHWREQHLTNKARINRPRQIYIGHTLRPYVPIEKRT